MPNLFFKACLSTALCSFLAFSAPAYAQFEGAGTFGTGSFQDSDREFQDWGVSLEDPVEEKNLSTTDEYIAILYHRMTQREPRYNTWLRYSDEYAKATEFEREKVGGDLIESWQNDYRAMNYKDPVYVEQEVEISPYNQKYQGYLIKGVDKNAIFDFKYANKRYAIIPTKIDSYQWIPASGQAVDFVEQNLTEDRKAIGLFTVDIKYADRNRPFELRDRKYWLLMGTARKLELLTPKERTSIWSSDQNLNSLQRQRELLDLFRTETGDQQQKDDPFYDD